MTAAPRRHHLVQHGIDRLVVIGGDGSLSGLISFATSGRRCSASCWPRAAIYREAADRHPALMIAGLVGSIDNEWSAPT